MGLKQITIIGITSALISGGAAISAYFLSSKPKPKDIRAMLSSKGVKFLNVDTNEHDKIWESLILLLLAPNKDRVTKNKYSCHQE